MKYFSKATFLSFTICGSTIAETELDFHQDIAPILEQYCVSCHGPEKQKSDYRVDTFEAFMRPGESEEKPIIPYSTMKSPLMEYLLLPKSDDYAMPPEEKDTPSGEDLLKIAHWIYQGAKSKIDLNARLPIEELLGESEMASVTRLRSKGAIIHKRGEKEASLTANLQEIAETLTEDDILDIATIAPHIAELYVPNLPRTLKDYTWLLKFEKIERLDLNHADFSKEPIEILNKIETLTYLNLFGTNFTFKGVSKLEVPQNGDLYLGGTLVNKDQFDRIQNINPERTIYGNIDINATIAISNESLGNSNSFKPRPTIAQGKQTSPSGIRHSFLICGSNTAIFDENSNVIWVGPKGTRDGTVLENGNILISTKTKAREYKRDSFKVVWSYTLDDRNVEMGTVNRLPNGNTLIVERGALPRLLEVDIDGNIVIDVPLQPETENGHMQTRMARKLPNGNYLVPHLLAFKVKEYTPDGEIVNVIPTDLPELGGREAKNWPFTAIRLENGNTLVNLTQGNKSVEFAPNGSVAWRCDNSHVEGLFRDPCGGQRLANGNTIVCSYGAKKTDESRLFEVTPDKQVVWEFTHPEFRAHEVHILTTNGEANTSLLR